MTALLSVAGLRAGYGRTEVLHGIDLLVEQGGITALLGANGAGKTTTLRAILGAVRGSGEIRFAGERIERERTDRIARRGVALVPDGRGTFRELTVEENLLLGAYTRPARELRDGLARVFGYFPRLTERLRQQAGTLSGGEQQMLAIGRALLLRPRLLILDEPSFGLAPLIVRDIFAILGTLRRTEGVGILLVEQNAALALDLADQACLLETGRVVMAGPSATLKADDGVRRAYLGY